MLIQKNKEGEAMREENWLGIEALAIPEVHTDMTYWGSHIIKNVH